MLKRGKLAIIFIRLFLDVRIRICCILAHALKLSLCLIHKPLVSQWSL